MRYTLLLLLLLPTYVCGQIDDLLYSLELVECVEQKEGRRFPLTYNHILSTGYFTTQSARMGEVGTIGFGVAHAPPYFNWNGRVQPFSFLELTANYRIFKNCPDPSIGAYGFGDYADRGANVKVALLTPEQSFYRLPGVAFGIDDFMGSKKFTTYYIVGTQVWPELGIEWSFGWGADRYNGLFGGVNFFPFYRWGNKWTEGIGFTAEYDPTDYDNDPHPDGRTARTPINVGGKYVFGDLLELSASYIRGEEVAAAGSIHYNWGACTGFLPKVDDPRPYSAPVDREPLGCTRPVCEMIHEMGYALQEQGFVLTSAWLEGETLWLRVINGCYRQEHIVRERLACLLAALTPDNIEMCVVSIEANGVPCQQYVYPRELLLEYVDGCVGPYEFDIVTPRQEACVRPCGELIFCRRADLWRTRLSPRLENFFGSVSGKYKYDLGVKLDVEGFLPGNWLYEVQVSMTAFSDLNSISDFDIFHPSQLPNVATDYVRYRQSHALTWDRLYLQKSLNVGRGWFARAAGGYFQVNYAGVAGEVLYYPASANFAIGFEGAVVRKRRYTGLGFQSSLRHFEGENPLYSTYSSLQQYFLDLYMDIPDWQVFTKVSIGQFLAYDKGVRLEATKYFDSGLRLTGWITYTDARDQIHGENYFDRGIALEIPFDLFCKRSCRKVFTHAMAAWLRDAGYAIWTGRGLFETLNRERRW